ncbi:protein trichome birefringence-like 21 isoform X2 [Vicia villosa]|nr:protein trichome birefringence-like 21 isoform X2 [Vicia villosa]XP_058760022.1 protein trichome birefringence-like 21 isoform X2 [Vicia villosa]
MESCEVSEILKSAKNIPKTIFLFPLTAFILVLLLPLLIHFNQSSSKILFTTTTVVENQTTTTPTTSCSNLFSGKWVPYLEQSYYNETCPFIKENQNCFVNGRPDGDFLKWRWKPDGCELPLFDAKVFLKIVKGKSMAFVGDSIARNQMQSLLCLLSSVARPEDVTTKYVSKDDLTYFKWWLYADYNFTITMLWSPFLVKSSKSYIYNSSNFLKPESLYLDEPDTAWTSRIENYDYVIFSGGQWFFRPFTFYENNQVVGCQKCNNSIELNYYGYKKAYQTALKTITNHEKFKGLVFLATHSPNHFENGEWNKGGGCNRTQPFSNEQKWDVHPYGLEILHQIQIDEFSAAKKNAGENGSRFGLIDITDAMLMRPDAHPNKYWHAMDKNV